MQSPNLPLRALRGERYFRWRGGAVSRIEGLTDGVFAIALTLLVVSLQVPDDFDTLIASFRQVPVFAVCFALIVMIWFYHYQFHRRFGLENIVTVALNAGLLFLILLYVYPLKFLFAGVFSRGFRAADGQLLMTLYSGGVVCIFLLFVAMYAYAWKHREALELDPLERMITKSALREHTIHAAIGAISIALAQTSPSWVPLSGLVYFLVGPAQFLNGWMSGRAVEAAAAELGTAPLRSR